MITTVLPGALLIAAATAIAYEGDGLPVYTENGGASGGTQLLSSSLKYQFDAGSTWINTTQQTSLTLSSGDFV